MRRVNEAAGKNEKVEFLESEVDRLRNDRNEQSAYCQQLYETLEGQEEQYAREGGDTDYGEANEIPPRDQPSESKPRI